MHRIETSQPPGRQPVDMSEHKSEHGASRGDSIRVASEVAMLSRLQIKNFKLLRDVDLKFAHQLPTILIGPNASGKSTVLEVLDFVSRCAVDGLERAVTAHGGMAGIRTIGTQEPVKISLSWNFVIAPPDPEKQREWNLTWTIELGASPAGQVLIQAESLMDAERKLLETAEGERLLYNELKDDEAPTKISERRALAFEIHSDRKRYEGAFLAQGHACRDPSPRSPLLDPVVGRGIHGACFGARCHGDLDRELRGS
jgi:hypothetical protein